MKNWKPALKTLNCYSPQTSSAEPSTNQQTPPVTQGSTYTTNDIHKRQTSMAPAGFKPTIPTSGQPQTYALDRAATGISQGPICDHTIKWTTFMQQKILDKLPVAQLVKKFPAFYETQMFVTVFTTASHLPWSWDTSIQSTLFHPSSLGSALSYSPSYV